MPKRIYFLVIYFGQVLEFDWAIVLFLFCPCVGLDTLIDKLWIELGL
jgi:hypothetical protein